jgi:hypothetical protein
MATANPNIGEYASRAKALLESLLPEERQLLGEFLVAAGLEEDDVLQACQQQERGRRICAVLEMMLRMLRAN